MDPAGMQRVSGIWSGMIMAAPLAPESHKPEPEHIKRRQPCSEKADEPQQRPNPWREESLGEDLVFAGKSRQGRNSRDSKNARGHRPISDRDLGAQPTHFAHVLLAI